MSKKSFLIISSVVVFILSIPLIAMNFTDEVNWRLMDFVVAGALLFTTGFAFDFILKKVSNSKFRLTLLLSVLIIFLLIWAELAVGLFTTIYSSN